MTTQDEASQILENNGFKIEAVIIDGNTFHKITKDDFSTVIWSLSAEIPRLIKKGLIIP